jgi:hypothetical protein
VPREVVKVEARNECRKVPKVECNQVTRYKLAKKCVPQEVKKCRWVLWQVNKKVEEKVCKSVLKKRCRPVQSVETVQVAREERRKQCRLVPRQTCQDIQVRHHLRNPG